MFDSQLYPFVGRSRRLPLRDNNGRCVNQEGKHELHMIINFGQVNTSYLSSFTAIVKCKIVCICGGIRLTVGHSVATMDYLYENV